MNKFTWLLKRETWESRAIWMAPAICSAIILFGALVGTIKTGHIQFDADLLEKINSQLTPEKARGFTMLLMIGAGAPFLVTGLFTQFFYSLDTLYGERRDRSILFWRSLPVSDATTVLSKVAVAAIVIPLVAALAMIGTEALLFLIATLRAPAALSVGPYLWSPTLWAGWIGASLFLVLANALWFLPAIGWYLLVSAWATRSPFVFAVGAPAALMFAEKMMFSTSHFAHVVFSHYTGFAAVVLGHETGRVMITLDNDQVAVPASALDFVHPVEFLCSPAVWGSVALGVVFIGGAIWLRRYRDTVA